MDSSYITPFINSAQNVFSMMLGVTVQVEAPVLKSQDDPSYDVTGIIGMSGDMEGSVICSFETSTSERIVGVFTGTEMTVDHEDFADAIGELVNMISGGAKAQFKGKMVSISCPSVVIGNKHTVRGGKDQVTIMVPCKCDLGEFALEISIRQSCLQAKPEGADTSAA